MNNRRNLLIAAAIIFGVYAAGGFAEPSEHFKVFLCFGQSNMSGGNNVKPQGEDLNTNPRVFTLAFNDCSSNKWTKDEWYLAKESLHCGDGMDNLGPVLAFGKVMADSLPEDTIGLIPCGQWGVSIEHFMKGKSNTSQYKPNYPGSKAYEWMENRCKKAIERGVFSGIILHQGESNAGQSDWPDKVNTILEDLNSALEIEHRYPLVVGELLYGGQCEGHNQVIKNVPNKISDSFVASAEGLGGMSDRLHFNHDGQIGMGERMAVQMMKGIREIQKTSVLKPGHRIINATTVNSLHDFSKLYTLNGRVVSAKNTKALKPGNIYIVHSNINGASTKLMMAPAGR